MSTIAQALANVRASGCRVGTVFYDHEPKRPIRAGGPQWHYSVRLPDGISSRAMVVEVHSRTAFLDLGPVSVTVPRISDEHHLIIKGTNPVGIATVLDIVATLTRTTTQEDS